MKTLALHFLERSERPRSPRAWPASGLAAALVVLATGSLATTACSDDGLAPEAAAEAGSAGSRGSTSGSVTTSATVTITEGTQGMASGEGETGTTGQADTTFGLDDSGTGGRETDSVGTTGLPPGETEGTTGMGTGGPVGPRCVATETCPCDPGPVFCEALPPPCPPGEVPLVDPVAQCWEGSCVPTEGCFEVADCTLCEVDEACVGAFDLAGPHYTCQDIEPACMGIPDCACMPMACDAPAFMCVEPVPGSPEDLSCVCPAC